MDVGIFKASNARLIAWVVVPPFLITAVGLSSYAFQRNVSWQLEETKALSDVLPEVMQARKHIQHLFTELGLTDDKRITTGDQLTALLEEKAKKRNIDFKRTQILQNNRRKGSKIPTISLMVEASGEFSDFQLFLNDVKSAYPLVSARSINLSQAFESSAKEGFELKVVFDLLLVNDVMKAPGGIK